MDNELAAQAQELAIREFHKYLAFAIANGTLTSEAEKSLLSFGHEHRLTADEIRGYIDAELKERGAKRADPPAPPPPPARVAANGHSSRRKALPAPEEFMRMLRLSGLDSNGMTDDARDAFINMAENIGLDPGDAEDLVDDYLDEADKNSSTPNSTEPARAQSIAAPAVSAKSAATESASAEPSIVIDPVSERSSYPPFATSLTAPMIFIPSAEFQMGSEETEAAPNERPLTKVAVSRYYISKHPVTNLEFEYYDPSHKRKRAKGAGDRHPAVYVSSLEAIKFCQWLSARERKKYRLPSEAEWELAARGSDGRKYPWGNHDRRGDLANFADKNTVFAWSDREVDDGYPESSPVGAFPLGASPFGVEDMAGNVWEWCLDYFEPYRGTPKVNPHGPNVGLKRIYRGGSWKSRFNSLRATTRGSNLPNFSCNDLGFRIVCECD